MNATEIKAAAAKIADAEYYVAADLYCTSSFDVRSQYNGNCLARAETRAEANRKALRLAIGTLRLAKTYAGVADRVNRILNPAPAED